MKYFAITPLGAEEFFALEIKKFGIEHEINKQIVIFETENIEDIVYYTYTPKRICEFISQGKKENIEANMNREEGKSFGVRLKHPAEENPDRQKIESLTGSLINSSSGMSVNLKNPDYWFTIFVSENNYFLGKDIVHKDLDKRPYKVFNNPQAIKGNIAASTLLFANYDGSQAILDCFCRSGEIPIEAALMSNKISPWKYEPFDGLENKEKIKEKNQKIHCFDDLMANITASRKNAKLAGVDKLIDFSKTDVSWLDTKLEKNSIDLIITQPPSMNKLNKKAEKNIDEFFYQADFILKKGGRIIFISLKDEKAFPEAKKRKFVVVRKQIIMSGQQKYYLLEFSRE